MSPVRRIPKVGPWIERHLGTLVVVWMIVTTAAGYYAVTKIDGLVNAIQVERVRNIRDGCVSQNARNRDTKAEFDRAEPALPGATRMFTFRLVDRLAEVRDCDEVVRQQTARSMSK